MPKATTSEGLTQGPYVAAGVGFEPATFRTQGTEPTTKPPHLITGRSQVQIYSKQLHSKLDKTLKIVCEEGKTNHLTHLIP